MSDRVKGTQKSAAETLAEAGLQDALDKAVLQFEEDLETPLGAPTADQNDDYKASWGDFVVAGEEDIQITLPLADRAHAGRVIAVKNLEATLVTVAPAGDDTIDGTAANVTVAAGKCYLYVCQTLGKWIELWR